jgi:hypothetical protein
MLIHVKADLLVLFTDRTTHIKRNDHFTKLPVQGGKLEEHVKALVEKQKKKIETGEAEQRYFTFNIMIPTLNFNKVSVIFCDIWREEAKNERQFKTLVHDYFQSISHLPLRSLAIAEFTA